MAHPRCVGWGEMGLDYHYDTSPRPVQRTVFERQLRCAVRLNKPLTIHSREADDDTERILKELVPKDHRVCPFFSSLLPDDQLPYIPCTENTSFRSTFTVSPTRPRLPSVSLTISRICISASLVRSLHVIFPSLFTYILIPRRDHILVQQGHLHDRPQHVRARRQHAAAPAHRPRDRRAIHGAVDHIQLAIVLRAGCEGVEAAAESLWHAPVDSRFRCGLAAAGEGWGDGG